MNEISLRLPRSIYETLARRTPAAAYSELIATKKTTINDILCFGLYNTRIVRNDTGDTCAYVVEWINGDVTTVDTDGNLMGVDLGRGHVTADEALEIFAMHNEQPD